MWTFLSFLVCSSANVCHVTEPMELQGYAGLAACQVAGVMIQPTWEESHPGMKVKRIRCTLGKRAPAEDRV